MPSFTLHLEEQQRAHILSASRACNLSTIPRKPEISVHEDLTFSFCFSCLTAKSYGIFPKMRAYMCPLEICSPTLLASFEILKAF